MDQRGAATAGSASVPPHAGLSRAEARWFLLRYGGPLAVVPSLLQPAVVVAVAVALAAVLHQPWPLLVPLLALAVRPLLRRPDTLAVERDEEPDLHRLVDRIAAAIGTRAPSRLVLDPSPNAGFRRSRLSRRAELHLGLPLLLALDDASLSAVIAHELAHGLQGRLGVGDGDLAQRLVQTRRRVANTMATERRRGRQFSRSGARLARFLDATQPLARAMETSADRAAITAVGPDAMATALRLADRADAALALYQGFVVNPLVAGGARPASVVRGFSRWVSQCDTRILDRLAGWHDADADSDLDDHPLDRDRTNGPDDVPPRATDGERHREIAGHGPALLAESNSSGSTSSTSSTGSNSSGSTSSSSSTGSTSSTNATHSGGAIPPAGSASHSSGAGSVREVDEAVSRHPSGHHLDTDPVVLHDERRAEEIMARALLGRHRSLPSVVTGDDDSAITAWRQGAARLRLRLLKSGRRGRRVPDLAALAARLTEPSGAPAESATLVPLLVSLSVAFAVELADRGWIGPLPGTSALISPADTFDDAIGLAMQAIEDHAGIGPLADALRAGRPRLAST